MSDSKVKWELPIVPVLQDEELYDDVISVQKQVSGVINLKSMFENKPVIQPKPALATKPVPMVKPSGIQTQNGPTSEKRKSNLMIPDVFKTDTNNKNNGTTSPTTPKPNTLAIPKTGTEPKVTSVSPLNSPMVMTKNSGDESKIKSSEESKPKETTKEKAVPATSKTSSVHELAAKLDIKNILKPVPKTLDKPTQIQVRKNVNKPSNDNDAAASVILRKKTQHNQQQKPQSRKSFLRSDGKKYLLVDKSTINSKVDVMVPAKPESLNIEIDMESLRMDFQAEKSSQETSNSSMVEECEEIYDDVANVAEGRKTAVSFIEELTEEEEKQWQEENDFPPPPEEIQTEQLEPDETYDDASSKNAITAAGDEENQEMYEELPEGPSVTQSSSDSSGDSSTLTTQSEKSVADEEVTSLKKKEKDKKSKDKEKDKAKEKEKAKEKDKSAKDKDPEKKRKKIEANNNKILKELKMKPDEILKGIGQGRVKESNPGGKNNSLAVTKGLLITIIKVDLKDKKYKGKWLVQTEENEVGFVDSQNVEMMQGKNIGPKVNQIDGEEYEDVPDANAGNPQEEEGEQIYEAVED